MNNIYKLIIIFPFLLSGCKPSVTEGNIILQKIDSLDMNIYSNQGEKIYRITSPNSSYDIVKQTLNLKKWRFQNDFFRRRFFRNRGFWALFAGFGPRGACPKKFPRHKSCRVEDRPNFVQIGRY